jgi:hypothetical protein
MLDRLPNSVLIIDLDIADVRSIGANVHEYERNFTKPKVMEQRLFHRK